MFRPEFMRLHAPYPLCPDALSTWGFVEGDHAVGFLLLMSCVAIPDILNLQSFEEHNAEIVAATQILVNNIIPLFGKTLDLRYDSETHSSIQIRHIILQIHRKG